jgi:ubiquinone/menaquinone biosynthesis C-methylase UbiE
MVKNNENIFEIKYRAKGFQSQRFYPNEMFTACLGSNFFSLPREKRSKLKVLEIGCGSGANLWMVAKEGFDAYGLDLSLTGIKLCTSMLEHWNVMANLLQGDMVKLPYQDNCFDIIFDVVSMESLTFKQHEKSYKEIYRCLKNGGLFYSYHLGENSISLKSTNDMIDHCTVVNIPEGYPLANNGQICFISANEVRNFLWGGGFNDVIIEKVTRTYANQTQYIEYLSIIAKKPIISS